MKEANNKQELTGITILRNQMIFDYVDSHVGLLKNTAKARSRIYQLTT